MNAEDQATHSGISSRQVEIRPAGSAAELEQVRELMREYGFHLAHLAESPESGARICIAGYDTELAGLPAPYVAPGGLLLALVNGEAAGCVALKQLRPAAMAEEAMCSSSPLELKRLWVRPGFRGLRLGQTLMQAAIDHARASGSDAIYLDTVPAAMPEANRLYAAMGFEPVGRYNDNPVPDIAFFRLRLAAAS